LPFLKSSPKSSSTNLTEKNHIYHKGKGITEAYLLDGPLEFKPLSRTKEDAIFTISHMKLAITYRPMVQQVHINNLMQKYITLYRDADIKLPFKTRPMKKRRNPTKQQQLALAKANNTSTKSKSTKTTKATKTKPRRQLPKEPLIKCFTAPKSAIVVSKSAADHKIKRLSMEYNDSKLNELLERGIEFDQENQKSKRHSKTKQNLNIAEQSSFYKNLAHSVSLENFKAYNNSNELKLRNQYSKSTISLDWSSANKRMEEEKSIKSKTKSKVKPKSKSNKPYYVNDSDSDSSSSSDDDDDIPLGMLRNRRASLSSIMTV
jgi:hypothetical protein